MRLLTANELPEGVEYPSAFTRLLGRGFTLVEPWRWLDGDELRERTGGLRNRFPKYRLVPFARRVDCDDVACWEAGRGDVVVVIHDFATVGYERRREFVDFYTWLRQAVDDMIELDGLG